MAPACQRQAGRAGSSADPAACTEQKPSHDTRINRRRRRSLSPRLTASRRHFSAWLSMNTTNAPDKRWDAFVAACQERPRFSACLTSVKSS